MKKIKIRRILRGCVDWNTGTENNNNITLVASYVDAWIETRNKVMASSTGLCRILRGCVDWNSDNASTTAYSVSRILRGCVDWNASTACSILSGRVASYVDAWIETISTGAKATSDRVASYTGAWIETWQDHRQVCRQPSHPIRVRGLKPVCWYYSMASTCRILYGCVDWNGYIYYVPIVACVVASYTGAWIETPSGCSYIQLLEVASYVGAWIETANYTSNLKIQIVASYVGAWIEIVFIEHSRCILYRYLRGRVW